MRKVIISLLIATSSMFLVGCGGGDKSYNTIHDESKAITDDVRVLDSDRFNSSFELLSCEAISKAVDIYVVRYKDDNSKYMITTISDKGVSVTKIIE